MKKAIAVIILIFMCANLSGCSDQWRRKFIRKKKEPVKMPRVHQIKKYEKKPTPELYQKHFAYWVSWQSELLTVLGQNHKKDMRCMEEIVGNLKDMQAILVPEKAAKLAPHIERIVRVRDIVAREELTQSNSEYVRMTLEREDRAIKREFSYSKVKKYLKTNFDEGEESQTK